MKPEMKHNFYGVYQIMIDQTSKVLKTYEVLG